jgi:ferredoxin
MAQIFHPSTNTISKVTIFGAVFFVGATLVLMGAINRSPYMTWVDVVRAQPVPFSHKHHVAGLGLDCRYCHDSVEQAAFAGMPASKTCMTCHSQIWTNAEMLEPVRESYRTDSSIPWTRVHDLPDFAYFNHSIHVAKGVGCQTCHGEVDQMPLAWREHALNMEWCLSCHRDPQKYLRPREEVFNMHWTPPENSEQLGRELMLRYHVQSKTNCSTCHR